MTFDAVITAGGRIDGEFATLAGTGVKALAPVGGVAMLQRVIDAVRGSGARSIAVVGGEEVAGACGWLVDRIIPEAASGEDNVSLALSAWPQSGMLYAASDLPFVDASSISEFLDRAALGAVAMALANADEYDSMFAGSSAHAVVLGRERVANGSVFYFPPGTTAPTTRFARKLFAARKSATRMAALLGPEMMLRLAVKRLRIADIERRARRLVGVDVCAVRGCAPQLCFDVDSLSDYVYALARA